MRVLQVPFTFHPDPCGGTEVYVASLCEELAQLGGECVVAAPGDSNQSYAWCDLEVRRFTGSPVRDVAELYGEGDPVAAEAFDRVLEDVRPDVVHFHARTHAASLTCVRKAKQRGMKVVYTYHTPTATCARGTMMLKGSVPCDGEMTATRCVACALSAKMPGWLAAILAAVPPSMGRLVNGQGGAWTALRMSSLQAMFQRTVRQYLSEVDHIVAVCEWVKQVILRNGVPAAKVTLNRQGLAGVAPVLSDETPRGRGRLRLAFLGRLDVTKGADVLLQALKLKPDLPVALDIFGIAQGEAGGRYRRMLEELAGGDSRVTFRAPVAGEEVVSMLRGYDLLVVPSQWLETGPLVVLEAFAAGVPVLGSRLGGIAELVTDGRNGVLVDSGDPAAWAEALADLHTNAGLLQSLRAGIEPPRTMKAVATEMFCLYQQVLST